jgi:mannose-6-phosphate isomerase-like protein (cupin superfamily)
MADGWTVLPADHADDVLGDYPGEMRMLAAPLGTEQVAFTYRRMPAETGSKGSYGHRHKTQEEVYFVISGRLQFKLEDEIVDVGPLTAVRVAPGTARGVWNEGPDDAQLVIISKKIEDTPDEVEKVDDDFWPAG